MITVKRGYLPDCTPGQLKTDGFMCLTLELPWKQNKQSISCIPEGTYKYRIAASPRTGNLVIWIDNVPNRTSIQIHAGNYTRQIEGCCLVGESVKDIDHDGILDVTNSKNTLKALIAEIPTHGKIRFEGATK